MKTLLLNFRYACIKLKKTILYFCQKNIIEKELICVTDGKYNFSDLYYNH